MAKLDCTITLKNMKGEVLKDGERDYTLGGAISNILLADPSGGKMKMYVLAKKFSNEDSVEVDEADLALIKQAAERTTAYTTLLAGQVLVLLEQFSK